jgi:UDPglucose--hexose-1-phosphate uridylyltransferase
MRTTISASHLRQDPATHEWVIFAPERASRPGAHNAKTEISERVLAECPFCPGNEHLTPSELYRIDKNGNWQVRVVPNRFAALHPGIREERTGSFFRMATGSGHHEVIIESPKHNDDLCLMEVDEIAAILTAYQERHRQLSKDPNVRYITIFRNHGPGAGTSLSHPHSQLLATPVVPAFMRTKHEIAERYFDDTNRNLYSSLRDAELQADERIVLTTSDFVAFVPFAAFVPYEMWIMPCTERASFCFATLDELHGFAFALRTCLTKLQSVCGDVNYNYILHSSPIKDEQEAYYSWHLQIIPRLTQPAGLELGSHMYINPVLPEIAASKLREAMSYVAQVRQDGDHLSGEHSE